MSMFMRALLVLLAAFVAQLAHAATPDQPPQVDAKQVPLEEHWRVDGGEIRLRFNDDFLDLFGIKVLLPKTTYDASDPMYSIFPLRHAEGLKFNAPEGGFDRFIGGSLKVADGFRLRLPDGSVIDQRNVTLRVNPDNPMHIDLVGSDGQVWLYFNHLMYKMMDDFRIFYVRSADLRATPALAKRLGAPELERAYVGEMRMTAYVVAHSRDFIAAPKCPSPNFHGNPLPGGGGSFQADVLIETYSMFFSRCRRGDTGANGCDGLGADNGEVVFTPSATLRNSDLDSTADVSWYRKFTTSPYDYPYPGNDQHPYLIWNIYRVVDDQLEQIGESGVKHAFLTINSGCAPGACTASGHILGRRCGDVYGTGNNDSSGDLGPRHELVPSTGVWGRCGSIFDPNCVGSETNPVPNNSYGSRLVVRESQMLVPGSSFFSEAWYLVQDDINIYNTMAHRTMNPAPGGTGWTPGTQGSFVIGPVINTWVSPVTFPTRNIEFDTAFGHARVAVKVKELASCPAGSGLSGTCYRYDYAVNNFDYTVATTSGALPDLEVESNLGFDRFSVEVPGDTSVHFETGVHFADTDINPGNNWTPGLSGGFATWTAPASNELNWGLLYRFSFVADAGPTDSDPVIVRLRPATLAQGATTLSASMTGPSNISGLFRDGFESD